MTRFPNTTSELHGDVIFTDRSTDPVEDDGRAVMVEKRSLLQDDAQNPKLHTTVSVKSFNQDEERRRQSTSSTMARRISIHWRSPFTMIMLFFVGLGSALALHGYYSSLNDKKVGDSAQQQKSLRHANPCFPGVSGFREMKIGTALALMTQISLVGSIHFAYVQCLWRALKRSVISVRAVDAGFSASSTLLSFTNMEMLFKLRLASFLALMAWCIPIASFVTPATLNVDSIVQSRAQMVNVSTLQIAKPQLYFEFAYVPSRATQIYLGPRTILTRLAVATATAGQVLSRPAPLINATYEQDFYAPYVQCQDANNTIVGQIDMAAERARLALDPSIVEVSNEYFAFVPALVNISGLSLESGVQVANLSGVDGAINASNQLWLKFPRYAESVTTLNVNDVASPHYLSCELYNASYRVNFSFANGIQSVDMPDPVVENVVPYPTNGSMEGDILAYSALMWALSNQLTGSMGFFQPSGSNGTNTTFSDISSNIDQTSLLGSSDFNSYFIKNHALGGNTGGIFSNARLQDMAYARNRTLDVLIPELSSNITLSLISNQLFSPSTMTNVTTATHVNIYSYQPLSVLISYTLALLFALLANVLGLFAYFSNGVSHDNLPSSIICTTRDIHFSSLNAHERVGALPLDPKVGRTKLRFDVGEDGGSGRRGFGVA